MEKIYKMLEYVALLFGRQPEEYSWLASGTCVCVCVTSLYLQNPLYNYCIIGAIQRD